MIGSIETSHLTSADLLCVSCISNSFPSSLLFLCIYQFCLCQGKCNAGKTVIVIRRHALEHIAHTFQRLPANSFFFSFLFNSLPKVSNWKKVLERLVDYYEVHLGQRLSGFTMPDVSKIGELPNDNGYCYIFAHYCHFVRRS